MSDARSMEIITVQNKKERLWLCGRREAEGRSEGNLMMMGLVGDGGFVVASCDLREDEVKKKKK